MHVADDTQRRELLRKSPLSYSIEVSSRWAQTCPLSAPIVRPLSAPKACPLSAPIVRPLSVPKARQLSARIARPLSAPKACPLSEPTNFRRSNTMPVKVLEHVTTNFDDPRSSKNVQDYRSGRLHIQRFPEGVDMPDMTKEIRPGCIGPCLYTLRVQNAAAVRARVSAAEGSEVNCRVMSNEFGEPSFSFVSPDGYVWNALQA